MNKRQRKKKLKKCFYPLIDEFNLMTLNGEELKRAYKDYQNFCLKNYSYFHYRHKEMVKNKALSRKPFYRFSIGVEFSEHIKYISNLFTINNRNNYKCTVTQSVNDFLKL